jgi:hypothetical protein
MSAFASGCSARTSSGSLAMLAAIRRASSRVSKLRQRRGKKIRAQRAEPFAALGFLRWMIDIAGFYPLDAVVGSYAPAHSCS